MTVPDRLPPDAADAPVRSAGAEPSRPRSGAGGGVVDRRGVIVLTARDSGTAPRAKPGSGMGRMAVERTSRASGRWRGAWITRTEPDTSVSAPGCAAAGAARAKARSARRTGRIINKSHTRKQRRQRRPSCSVVSADRNRLSHTEARRTQRMNNTVPSVPSV